MLYLSCFVFYHLPLNITVTACFELNRKLHLMISDIKSVINIYTLVRKLSESWYFFLIYRRKGAGDNLIFIGHHPLHLKCAQYFFQSSWNCWFNWFLVSIRFILFLLSIVGEKYFQLHYLYSTKNLLCSQIWISRSFTYMYQIKLLLCSIVTVLYNGKITVKCTILLYLWSYSALCFTWIHHTVLKNIPSFIPFTHFEQ